MKKHKKLITVTAIILALLIVFGVIFGKRIYNYFTGYVTPKITSQSLPIKAELSKGNSCIIDFYKERSGDKYIFARNPWDMQTYNGRVYISSGDYSENSGDTPIYYYDLKSDSFDYLDIVYTEQAARFFVINDELYTTATDPIAWGVGEYYKLNDSESGFDYYEVLPSNIHCYDMVEFDNKFFFCGSVESYENYSMVQYIDSENMPGNNFDNTKQIYLYKDSKQIDNNMCYRVYDMFEYKDKLYIYHYGWETTTGLYCLNTEKMRFEYVGDEMSLDEVVKNSTLNLDNESNMLIQRKFQYNEKMVFINGDLFYTDDLKNYKVASFGEGFENYVPRDALEIENQLYVLASKQLENGKYTTSVFVTENLENYTEVLNFETQSYINSFEYIDKTFVFGEGGTSENTNENCGMLYTFKLSK